MRSKNRERYKGKKAAPTIQYTVSHITLNYTFSLEVALQRPVTSSPNHNMP